MAGSISFQYHISAQSRIYHTAENLVQVNTYFLFKNIDLEVQVEQSNQILYFLLKGFQNSLSDRNDEMMMAMRESASQTYTWINGASPNTIPPQINPAQVQTFSVVNPKNTDQSFILLELSAVLDLSSHFSLLFFCSITHPVVTRTFPEFSGTLAPPVCLGLTFSSKLASTPMLSEAVPPGLCIPRGPSPGNS